MHAAVISFWLLTEDWSNQGWEAQRQAVFASAVAGDWWGTIASEPGSGGDLARTRATATPSEGAALLPGRRYAVTGDKHFGSGLGVVDRMITTAIPEGESDPTIFVLDVTDKPWDGSEGFALLAEWDGMGMAATQSHAMRLERAAAVRLACNGPIPTITAAASPLIALILTAVILGVVDEAVEVARGSLRERVDRLRAYERVEWTRAEQDHWVAVQAYEGGLRSLEGGPTPAAEASLRAKEAVAELAEQTLQRLGRILGGGTLSRRSPFAHWFEDVRTLGFLRPPWGLAYDSLYAMSFK
jgi:alkylation response protein AidB-like acyl-CoA dehydrogenase